MLLREANISLLLERRDFSGYGFYKHFVPTGLEASTVTNE